MNAPNQKATTEVGLAARLREKSLDSERLLDLVGAYLSEADGRRLLLPTIQRSLVWTNEQIINYWDSLLRGWFPGLMLVHEPDEIGDAVDSGNKLTKATAGDLELLDGQQRMAAILLGFGVGPLAKMRRLWIDLDGKTDGKRRLSFRVTSPGQPFGYRSAAPNSRLHIPESRQAWDAWLFGISKSDEKTNKFDWTEPQQIVDAMRARYNKTLRSDGTHSELLASGAKSKDVQDAMSRLRPEAFSHARAIDLFGVGTNVFPLAPLLRSRVGPEVAEVWHSDSPDAQKVYEREAGEAFEKLIPLNENANFLKDALDKVLVQPMAIKMVGKELFEKRGDYEEFFKRIGQGGTPLSDDELSYSLIKARIPKARQALEEIVRDPTVGRLASPTQIALAGLRLARMRIPQETNNIWERVGRPSSEFVSSLPFGNEQPATTKNDQEHAKWERLSALARTFENMLKSTGNSDEKCELHLLMLHLRELLGGKSALGPDGDRGTGFPSILLGRLPKEMIDTGLMLVGIDDLSKIEEKARRAFCLWCLTFGDASLTSNELALAFVNARETEGGTQAQDVLRQVVEKMEIDGHADLAPTHADLKKLRKGLPNSEFGGDTEPLLQDGNARFKPHPDEVDPRIGSAISELNFASSHGKNALLWLQRNYLGKNFDAYDPTSDRDEDLPIDLDHLVPQERFAFWWQDAGFPSGQNGERLKYPEDKETLNNLWRYRGEVGNLIGNLRWLSSSENRGLGSKRAGDGAASLKGEDDLTSNACDSIGDRQFDNLGSGDTAVEDLKASFGRLIDLGPQKAIGFAGWSTDDIRRWQYLVEARQLELMRRLIDGSGIAELLPERQKRGAPTVRL